MSLKIGVVGCGHIVRHRHLPVFKKIPEADVVAICDLDESIAKQTAETFGIANYYLDMSDMLEKEELDVVDICTPPRSHLPLSKQVIEAGCHVLVEKPVAMNEEDVKVMYDIAEKKGVSICAVHQNLYNPAVLKAKSMIDKGEVGEIIAVDVGTYVRRNNYMCVNSEHWCHKLPGGIFFEILPHPIYLLQMYLNNIHTEEIVVKQLSDMTWMKGDELRALFNTDTGIGTLAASCNSPYHGDSMFIFGTKMALQVDLWGRSVIKYRERTEEPISVGKHNINMTAQSLGLLGTTMSNAMIMTLQGEKVSAHYGFLNAYVNSVLNDRRLPVTKDEAIHNVRIVEEICKKVDEKIEK